MIVYYSVLLSLLGIFFVHSKTNLSSNKTITKWLYAVAWIVLIAVAGLRYQVGKDYIQYSINYSYYLTRAVEFINQPALTLVAWIARFLHNDYATWFFLMAIITSVPVAYVVKKESIAVGFSTILFLLLGCWHTSFNIVKQSAAASIIFMGYRSLVDRKFWKWTLFCFIASLFHVTALFMIPLYFLIDNKINWRKTGTIIIAGVLITLLYEELFNIMGALRGDSATSISSAYGTEQLNVLRILAHCAPPLLASVLLKHFDKGNSDFCVLYNISLFNAVLNIVTAKSAYLNRFSIYTLLFNILFIPYLVKPFKKNSRFLVAGVITVLYSVFCFYDLYKGSTTVDFYWIFQR